MEWLSIIIVHCDVVTDDGVCVCGDVVMLCVPARYPYQVPNPPGTGTVQFVSIILKNGFKKGEKGREERKSQES